IRARFASLQSEGVGVAVVAAIDDADLMRIGEALAGMPLVTAGSGVAIGLPRNWIARGRLAAGLRADALPPARGLAAVVSGSCSVATNAQVRHWVAQGRPAFAVDPLAIARGEGGARAALCWARERLGAGPVLVSATAEPDAVRAAQAALGVARAGELVERTLAEVARGLVQAGVRQLVVAGGETSGAVVQALGVGRMAIGPQIDPGVPWTAVAPAACAGESVHLALKSGNFGTVDFFTKAFARLARA
ncbi:MAG TPA: nucleotide-binding domain containing protein, partial [Burkholderiaceae bacterium]|nr:nucleotide-binding domain containing protein [Burkholderiaceae bacterium]